MEFLRINSQGPYIQEVYDVLRLCGEDMYKNQGLLHWKNPYPIERITEDCINKEVYIVLSDGEPIATFQLCSINDCMLELSKFAVLPKESGKGVGKTCIKFIENECRTRGYRGISLDVYDKSDVAVNFYKKNGFHIIGTRPTRYFQVLLMEKVL